MDECEKRKAFHLSSGVALQDEIADEILNTFCEGQILCELFWKERLQSCEKLLQATPQKNNFMPFLKFSAKCTKKSKDGKTKTKEMNRSILVLQHEIYSSSRIARDFSISSMSSAFKHLQW